MIAIVFGTVLVRPHRRPPRIEASQTAFLQSQKIQKIQQVSGRTLRNVAEPALSHHEVRPLRKIDGHRITRLHSMNARFSLGIDLGTSNSAIAVADLESGQT